MGRSIDGILGDMQKSERSKMTEVDERKSKDKKKKSSKKLDKEKRKREKKEKKDKSEKKSRKRTADDASLDDTTPTKLKKTRDISVESGDSESLPNGFANEVANGLTNGYVEKPSAPKMEEEEEDTTMAEKSDRLKKDDLQISNFDMSPTTVRLLKEKGIESLFDIQAATYNILKNEGKDVIGRARTGSGKTLAFVLPIVESIIAASKQRRSSAEKPLVLVLAPTRELAQQVHRDFEHIAGGHRLSTACFYGGSPKGPQKGALRRGLDVLVGTPGRTLDHLEEGQLNLSHVEYVVLDEADEMLSMGFQEDVEKILRECKSSKKQMLLFSATVPKWVTQLAKKYMRTDATATIDTVHNDKNRTNSDITHYSLACPWRERPGTLADVVMLHCGASGKALIFTDTKAEANELAEHEKLISALGGIGVLHGDIPQAQRERILKSYRIGRIRALVATDVAARGLDIDGVDLILQTHPPSNYETYIHRSGRTGRAGKQGKCVLFYSPREKYLVGLIEHKAGIKFKRASPPQAASIIRSNVSDLVEKVSSVHPANIEVFRSAADRIKKELPGTDNNTLLACTLACLTGYGAERIKARSLLSCFEGWIAVKMVSRTPLESSGHAWSIARRSLGPAIASEVKGMALCKNQYEAVFDMPQKFQDDIGRLGGAEHKHVSATFVIPDAELPELKDEGFDLYEAQRMLADRRSMDFQRRSGKRGGGWGNRSFGKGWSGNGSRGRSGGAGRYNGFRR